MPKEKEKPTAATAKPTDKKAAVTVKLPSRNGGKVPSSHGGTSAHPTRPSAITPAWQHVKAQLAKPKEVITKAGACALAPVSDHQVAAAKATVTTAVGVTNASVAKQETKALKAIVAIMAEQSAVPKPSAPTATPLESQLPVLVPQEPTVVAATPATENAAATPLSVGAPAFVPGTKAHAGRRAAYVPRANPVQYQAQQHHMPTPYHSVPQYYPTPQPYLAGPTYPLVSVGFFPDQIPIQAPAIPGQVMLPGFVGFDQRVYAHDVAGNPVCVADPVMPVMPQYGYHGPYY